MKVIVGLGNPGSKYSKTPHNAGFIFVESLYQFLGYSKLYNLSDWEMTKDLEAEVSEGRVGGERRVMLIKPMTFMNGSGRTVSKIVRNYKIDISADLVLVHDDLDLRLGEYKIQVGRSPKQHNGVNHVLSSIGRADFLRVRIGVDNRPAENRMDGESYVLTSYNDEELETLKEASFDAIKTLRTAVNI